MHDGRLQEVLKTARTRPLFVMRLAVRPPVMVGNTPGAFRRIGQSAKGHQRRSGNGRARRKALLI